MYCFDTYSQSIFESLSFLLFSPNLDALIYYSHIPASIIALTLAIFILLSSRELLAARLLFVMCVLFGLWSFIDLLIWTQVDSGLIMFLWSFWFTFFAGLFVVSYYFLYTFSMEKDLSIKSKVLLLLPILPVLLFSSTNLTLVSFDVDNCNAVENSLIVYYTYILASIYFIGIAALIYRITKFSNSTHKKRSLYAGLGVCFFLLSFSVSTYIASFYAFFTSDPNTFYIEQYGYFGMTVFIVLLSYVVVKYQAFRAKLIAAQALVTGLVILIGSQLFFVRSTMNQILVVVTLVLALIGGFFLVKSVKREIKQREELEILTDKLEAANERLKELDKAKSEFVSIASHQLRSPLTAIRGYASMLAEGSFGKLPAKAEESAKRIEESAKLMAMSVEDYLNVSRIESGNMKYNLSDFNLLELTSKICDDLRPDALKHSLILLFRSDIKNKGIVNADVGKTHQIIHNLINNSIKYTPKGSVSVFVHDDLKAKKIYIDIIDTGIGMSKETMDKLFGKFSRANNANSVNTSGTGLGLYVALKMAQQMGGNITCTSEGDGKGSTFTFELPLAM
jgi:signal transduction histidine kinase